MKTLSKIIAVACGTFALMGCDTDLEKEIKLSNLLNKPMHTETAVLNVEISSCHDYEDSRQPSDSLIKVKDKLPRAFPELKYTQCFSKGMDSFASFEMPINVGSLDLTDFENGDVENLGVSVVSSKKKNTLLTIVSMDDFSNKVRKMVKRELRFQNFNFNVILNIKNDLPEDVNNLVYKSFYLDGMPIAEDNGQIPKNKSFKIKLSNVSADQLWKTKGVSAVNVITIENPQNNSK